MCFLSRLIPEWERATAFAVAAMRQQSVELFDLLVEAHDKVSYFINNCTFNTNNNKPLLWLGI